MHWIEPRSFLLSFLVFTPMQVICHPVDTVKTRMQIKDPTKKLKKWRRKISKKAFELGPLDIDNWFFKGPGDLFRGVWGAVLGTIPNAMLYFVAYECECLLLCV